MFENIIEYIYKYPIFDGDILYNKYKNLDEPNYYHRFYIWSYEYRIEIIKIFITLLLLISAWSYIRRRNKLKFILSGGNAKELKDMEYKIRNQIKEKEQEAERIVKEIGESLSRKRQTELSEKYDNIKSEIRNLEEKKKQYQNENMAYVNVLKKDLIERKQKVVEGLYNSYIGRNLVGAINSYKDSIGHVLAYKIFGNIFNFLYENKIHLYLFVAITLYSFGVIFVPILIMFGLIKLSLDIINKQFERTISDDKYKKYEKMEKEKKAEKIDKKKTESKHHKDIIKGIKESRNINYNKNNIEILNKTKNYTQTEIEQAKTKDMQTKKIEKTNVDSDKPGFFKRIFNKVSTSENKDTNIKSDDSGKQTLTEKNSNK